MSAVDICAVVDVLGVPPTLAYYTLGLGLLNGPLRFGCFMAAITTFLTDPGQLGRDIPEDWRAWWNSSPELRFKGFDNAADVMAVTVEVGAES